METNMNWMNFNVVDIWTKPARLGGGRKNPSYEVYLTVGPTKRNNGDPGRDRVTFALRNKAYEIAKGYDYVYVSSFELVGDKTKVFFKFTREKKDGAYKLSKASGTDNQLNVQLTPPDYDLEVYKTLYAGGTYKIKPFGADIYYFELESREEH